MVRARPYGLAKGLMVPCEAHHLIMASFVARPVMFQAASEATERKGAQAPFLFAWPLSHSGRLVQQALIQCQLGSIQH